MDQPGRNRQPEFGHFIPMVAEHYNQPVFPMNFNQNMMQYSAFNQPNHSAQTSVNFGQFGGRIVDDIGVREERTSTVGNHFTQSFIDGNIQSSFDPYYNRPTNTNNMPKMSNVHNDPRQMENVTITEEFPQDFQYLLKGECENIEPDRKGEETENTEIDKEFNSQSINALSEPEQNVDKNGVKEKDHANEEAKISDAQQTPLEDPIEEALPDDNNKQDEKKEPIEESYLEEVGDKEEDEDAEMLSEDDLDDDSLTEDEVNSTESDTDGDEKKSKKTEITSKGKKPKKEKFVIKIKSKSAILTEKKEHKCLTCGKIVNSLRAYEKHLNLHTDKYSCKICSKRFNSQSSLNTHGKIHEGYVGSEQCNVCDKIFYDKSSLNKHTLSVHMGITNFTCEYCDKSFFAKKTYEEHIRVHTGERPFKCTTCPKSYKRISDLNHHIRLHKGETKHTCEVCGDGFRRISELNRHKLKHETSGDSYVRSPSHMCEWCHVNFSTAKALKQHISTHFETMCFDNAMSRPYDDNQGLVDGIIQNLSTKFIQENVFEDLNPTNISSNQADNGLLNRNRMELPSFTSAQNLSAADTSRQYSSISQNPFGNANKTESREKVFNATKTSQVENMALQTTVKDDTKLNPVGLKQKFEIKVENVEEDGVDCMYLNMSGTSIQDMDNGDDDDEMEFNDHVEHTVKDDYEADTDVEDYSYIIKNEDGNFEDFNTKSKKGKKAVKGKGKTAATKSNGTNTKKRSRKGQPTKKAGKPKIVQITNDEVLSDDDFLDEIDDIIHSKDELKDADFEPTKTKDVKKKGAKTKKGKRVKDEDRDINNEVDTENGEDGGKSNKKKKKATAGTKEKSKKDFQSLVCEECGKTFSSVSCLMKHSNLHTGLFSCGTCGKSCASRHSLEVHEGLHDGKRPRPAVCNVCDKAFYDASSMNKHVKNVHMNFKPFPCPHCERRFSEKKTLAEHIRTHTGERPFQCEVCQKTYKRKSELNYHMMLHTGEKKIICGECGKGFRRMTELRHHNVVKHGADRPFMCNLCGKKFTSKTQLNEHTRRHFGIRNHECSKCFKTFYTKSKLKRHLQNKVDCINSPDYVNGKFQCKYCMEEFKEYQELKVHIRMKHTMGKYPCKVCGKEFNKASKLKRHMKIHTNTRDFICNICGAGFIQKHHLSQHLRTHSGEKPYQCMICFRSFAQSGTLYSHMKHHTQPPRSLYKTPSPSPSPSTDQESTPGLNSSRETIMSLTEEKYLTGLN